MSGNVTNKISQLNRLGLQFSALLPCLCLITSVTLGWRETPSSTWDSLLCILSGSWAAKPGQPFLTKNKKEVVMLPPSLNPIASDLRMWESQFQIPILPESRSPICQVGHNHWAMGWVSLLLKLLHFV